MRKQVIGKLLLPFGIIVALSALPFAFFCYQQVQKFGMKGLFLADFEEFALFYVEAALITAGVISVATFVQAAFRDRRTHS